MLIELSTAFAMRCPDCGRLDVHQLNIFQLSGKKEHNIYCECGSRLTTIVQKGKNNIMLRYKCIICDRMHRMVVVKDKFWNKYHLNNIVCTETNLNLGYYGSFKLIKNELDKQQKELDSMATDLGFDDFVDPELMLDVLDYLHDTSARGALYCNCGSHDINIELFSDRVELNCNNCGASLIIPATGKRDLDHLKIMDEVVLKLSTTGKNSKGPWINI